MIQQSEFDVYKGLTYTSRLQSFFLIVILLSFDKVRPWSVIYIQETVRVTLHAKMECPIHNGSLETWFWSNMWKISSFSWLEKSFFLWWINHTIALLARNAQVIFAEKPQMQLNSLKIQKHGYNAYKDQTKLSRIPWQIGQFHLLLRGSLEI